MPHKTSVNEDTTPPVTLRRSPRFRQIVLEDPKTPNPDQHRITRSHSLATPLSSTPNTKLSVKKRTHRSKPKECSQKLDESCNAGQTFVDSNRRNRCGSDRRSGKLEKRVTRSSYCRDSDNTSQGCSSSVSTCKQIKDKSRKNKVKHGKENCDNSSVQFDTLGNDEKISERLVSIDENRVLDEELPKPDEDRVKDRVVVQEGSLNVRDVNKKQKNIGVKRTRNQFENIAQGWSKDQESALERAYLQAKPTPHFWKKVSRLVPGKSAQECFDKIHGSHLTPPPPRTRCRARVSSSQNPSFSASKLINTSSPTKKPRYRKQKSHIVQRTVRHMLQNQCKVKQDSESDLFSLLEPTFNPSLNFNLMLSTPDRNQETDDVHKSSSTVRRSGSRFSGSYGTTLVSPPVLKQVKNKALHEKYIDLLNCREANRKAASAKAEKVNKRKVMKQENSAERKEALKAAKNALVFGAKDAINEFQYQQATALNDLFDYVSDADEESDQVY